MFKIIAKIKEKIAVEKQLKALASKIKKQRNELLKAENLFVSTMQMYLCTFKKLDYTDEEFESEIRKYMG